MKIVNRVSDQRFSICGYIYRRLCIYLIGTYDKTVSHTVVTHANNKLNKLKFNNNNHISIALISRIVIVHIACSMQRLQRNTIINNARQKS